MNESYDNDSQLNETPAEAEKEEMTEAEKQEILSVFSETNENKVRKSGFKFTVKNQLILIGTVLAVAGLLFGGYFLFFKEKEPVDAKYLPGEETVKVLDALEEDVSIVLCNLNKKELDPNEDAQSYYIYKYAEQFADASKRVKLKTDPDEAYNHARVICNNKTVTLDYADFFVKRAIDGKVYGFNGEALLTNAVLELTGKEKAEFDVRPLDGFDKDGDDVLVSGGVVMFPMVNKTDIGLINVKNEYGDYTVYQEKGKFYFRDCELLSFDEELFASLIVDCRYVVTAGKLENQLDYAQYGLDKSENLTATFTLITNPDKNGNSILHNVWIGSKSASGAYYYAMYYGSLLDKNGQTVEKFVKPSIYKLPAANVETNLLRKKETYFTADLVYGVSSANDCTKADNIKLDYYHYDEENPDVSFEVKNLPLFSFSENATSNNSDAAEILKDKVVFTGKYTDWLSEEQKGYFASFNSSDGNPFYIKTSVINTAENGEYEVKFGLVKDSKNEKFAALMPDALAIRYSTDGKNYKKLPNVSFDFASQADNSVKQYSFKIQSEAPVVFVEMTFTMPKTIGYLVLDNIAVTADGEDAQPNDALTGQWRLISPAEYIPAGKNFSYLDSSNFSDFLYSLCTLKGDSVERVGFAKHDPKFQTDDVIDTEVLAEYGLDKPAMHFGYEFDSFYTDLYVSAYDEENACYYAYSTITGDTSGTGSRICFCTGMIARLSTATAAWLEWDPVEYIDHSLVGMFIYDIRKLTITSEGKNYAFDVEAEGKDLKSVKYEGKDLDPESFRYLYLSIVQLNMKSTYEPAEGEKPEEYMRIRIKSTSDDREYIFYRVSSSKAYYTVNGDGSYYCLVSALRNVSTQLARYIAGEDLS